MLRKRSAFAQAARDPAVAERAAIEAARLKLVLDSFDPFQLACTLARDPAAFRRAALEADTSITRLGSEQAGASVLREIGALFQSPAVRALYDTYRRWPTLRKLAREAVTVGHSMPPEDARRWARAWRGHGVESDAAWVGGRLLGALERLDARRQLTQWEVCGWGGMLHRPVVGYVETMVQGHWVLQRARFVKGVWGGNPHHVWEHPTRFQPLGDHLLIPLFQILKDAHQPPPRGAPMPDLRAARFACNIVAAAMPKALPALQPRQVCGRIRARRKAV